MPRMTVTGVRSSWPSREISSWRRAARSTGLLGLLELVRAAPLAVQGGGQLLDDRGRDLGRDQAAAGRRLHDGVEDRVAVGVLQHVSRARRRPACRGRACWSSMPVRATTPISGKRSFRCRVASMPSMFGMRRSISTTSGSMQGHEVQGLGAGARLPDHGRGRRCRAAHERLAEAGVVVDDQNLHRRRVGESLASRGGSPSSHGPPSLVTWGDAWLSGEGPVRHRGATPDPRSPLWLTIFPAPDRPACGSEAGRLLSLV